MMGSRTSTRFFYMVLLLCVWTLGGGFASHALAQGDQWSSNGLRGGYNVNCDAVMLCGSGLCTGPLLDDRGIDWDGG